ncbi:MAG: Wzt carbohydrate-binding domain-containing protein [Oscillospiraceae bacterium]|nr:Wzt carbohydrate-binding domain-containing protein [Oscillospiraceae bacterium]
MAENESVKEPEIVIDVRNIKKKFKVYFDKGGQLKERLLFHNRNRYEVREVLKGISFSVKKGQAVGLIGHNGCGKSTTLKLLTKIMYPDEGEIEMKGRVSSLIELGAGFHPDMSGRENIYTNASIFGLTKKEIDARLHDIIAFSELEDYIDNPVRTYSSGMYMRLAFSVAINVDADILLIDEILAVGDTNFQTKCFNRLRELKASGMTIIIVTHDLNTIEKFCDTAIWINEGRIYYEGRSAEVVDAYYNFMNQRRLEEEAARHKAEAAMAGEPLPEEEAPAEKQEEAAADAPEVPAADAQEEAPPEIDYSTNRFGLRYIEITKARMINKHGADSRLFSTGDDLTIEIDYQIRRPLDEYIFGFGFYSLEGECLYGNNTQLDRLHITTDQKTGTIAVDVHDLPLLRGKYILNVAVVDKDGTPMDFYRNYCDFEVLSTDRSSGYFAVQHEWREIR